MSDPAPGQTLSFAYRPKTPVMALAGLLFAGLAVALAVEAHGNDRGLVIDRIFELGPAAATGLYWLLALVCVVFAAVGVMGFVRSLGPAREIVLDGHGLTAPRNALRHQAVTVPYAAITGMHATQVRSQRFVTIHHAGGRLSLARGMLPTPADFDRLVAALDARVRATRHG